MTVPLWRWGPAMSYENSNRALCCWVSSQASQLKPHYKNLTLSSNKVQKWAACSNDKERRRGGEAAGADCRAQSGEILHLKGLGWQREMATVVGELRVGRVGWGGGAGVQTLSPAWWRHQEWTAGLQEGRLVNTTNNPPPAAPPPLDHCHTREDG